MTTLGRNLVVPRTTTPSGCSVRSSSSSGFSLPPFYHYTLTLPKISMLTSQLKNQWLAALRGTGPKPYTQTNGNLRDAQGHCCLGVLCDVIDPKRWVNEPDGSSNKVFLYRDPTSAAGSDDVRSGSLPQDFTEAFCPFVPNSASDPNDVFQYASFGIPLIPELRTHLATVIPANTVGPRWINSDACLSVTLASLNDLGFSFAQIADVIERFVPVEDEPADTEPTGEGR